MRLYSDNFDKPILSDTGCLIIPTKQYGDDRGFFFESFKHSSFGEIYREFYQDKSHILFSQDNISVSKKNVVRGMHFQNVGVQGKLVRVLNGVAIDVVIDIRKGSDTFGMLEGFILKAFKNSVYIPPGFAHGFWSIEDNTVFSYKCTNEYYPSGEGGINPLDKELKFPWIDFKDDLIVSPKDRALPSYEEWLDGFSKDAN